MTTYELEFTEDALKEWRKLGEPVRRQFSKKLEERLVEPRVPSARLRGLPDCYKIKLRTIGYRLVYRVIDEIVVVQVIAVGRRDKSEVYRKGIRSVIRLKERQTGLALLAVRASANMDVATIRAIMRPARQTFEFVELLIPVIAGACRRTNDALPI